ncbi:uncharacterized protein LOC133176922 [Saccostrea echinata]|uniref:uncharacterized protein LOC133176922 n=1 Tax=Saccostrea echinata TaxID=191078 RepID=UPI002A81C3B7|nr:uncharacterized protein LOC133176922 [Saccostrea echinata]
MFSFLILISFNTALLQEIYETNAKEYDLIIDFKHTLDYYINECQQDLKKEKMRNYKIYQETNKHLLNVLEKIKILNTFAALLPPNISCSVNDMLILPHPEECQLYYNCSVIYSIIPKQMEQHLMECDYPNLFSLETNRCDNFRKVACKTRREIKDKCKYRLMIQSFWSPEPCLLSFPSCDNKTDGLHEHGVKKPSPYFMICDGERFLREGFCPVDPTWNTRSFPYNGRCLSSFEIPRDKYSYGKLPSCAGKTNGSYQFLELPCDAFYKCQNGHAKATKCPENSQFDQDSGACQIGAICP